MSDFNDSYKCPTCKSQLLEISHWDGESVTMAYTENATDIEVVDGLLISCVCNVCGNKRNFMPQITEAEVQ